MTLKENVMKLLLEDGFNRSIVNASTESGGGSNFDVAETAAQSAINDNPSETDVSVLAGKAVQWIVSLWGF